MIKLTPHCEVLLLSNALNESMETTYVLKRDKCIMVKVGGSKKTYIKPK